MVDNAPQVIIKNFWVPTEAAGERVFWMSLEYSLNKPSKEGQSLAKVVWSTGDMEEAFLALPPIVPAKIRRDAQRLLQPWPNGRYTDAYRWSGGILNVFTPPWGEEQDKVWAQMASEWEDTSFAAEDAKQEALRELEQRWNHTPHPFFAGLTPAQVMVGGGPQEADLADEFLYHLTQMYDRRPFESEGEALIQTLTLLRGWECQSRDDGRTPLDIIIAERNDLLAQRERVLRGET